LNPLLQFKVAKIFLDDIRHGHAKSRREIPRRHGLLRGWIFEELNQTVGESLRVAWGIKFDGELFSLCHLPEVRQISADNGHAVGACQVRDPAASGGGRVRHDCDCGFLKQVWQRIFRNITAEFDARIIRAQLSHQVGIACRLRMVSASNDEFGIRQLCRDQVEGLDHQFEALVGSPFSEG
jgi:hypothetical protein